MSDRPPRTLSIAASNGPPPPLAGALAAWLRRRGESINLQTCRPAEWKIVEDKAALFVAYNCDRLAAAGQLALNAANGLTRVVEDQPAEGSGLLLIALDANAREHS